MELYKKAYMIADPLNGKLLIKFEREDEVVLDMDWWPDDMEVKAVESLKSLTSSLRVYNIQEISRRAKEHAKVK